MIKYLRANKSLIRHVPIGTMLCIDDNIVFIFDGRYWIYYSQYGIQFGVNNSLI